MRDLRNLKVSPPTEMPSSLVVTHIHPQSKICELQKGASSSSARSPLSDMSSHSAPYFIEACADLEKEQLGGWQYLKA